MKTNVAIIANVKNNRSLPMRLVDSANGGY